MKTYVNLLQDKVHKSSSQFKNPKKKTFNQSLREAKNPPAYII